MGLKDFKEKLDVGLLKWYLGKTYQQGIDDLTSRIRKIIKKGRLKFTGGDSIVYTDKKGVEHSYNYNQFAMEAIRIGGWQKQMDAIGLTIHDVKDILNKEYKKSKKENK